MSSVYTQTLDNVGAAITSVIQPYLVDVTFEDFALLAIMEEKGKVVQPDPSADISWPVVVDKLNTGVYSGLKRFPGQEKTIFDRAVLQWKNAYCDVVVSGPDALRARGAYAAFQLTDALKQAARMSIADEMGTQIYAAGDGDNWDGLRIAVDDGVLYTTYAGITRANVTGWNSYVSSTAAPFTLPLMTTALGEVTFGNDSPDLAITTQTIWNSAQNRAQAHQVFDRNDSRNNVAYLGFRVISHLGCDIVHDAKCPSTHMFGVHTEYSEMAVMPDRVWSWTGWERINGSDGFSAQFLLMGNWMIKSPRNFFKLSNLT